MITDTPTRIHASCVHHHYSLVLRLHLRTPNLHPGPQEERFLQTERSSSQCCCVNALATVRMLRASLTQSCPRLRCRHQRFGGHSFPKVSSSVRWRLKEKENQSYKWVERGACYSRRSYEKKIWIAADMSIFQETTQHFFKNMFRQKLLSSSVLQLESCFRGFLCISRETWLSAGFLSLFVIESSCSSRGGKIWKP